MLNYPQCRGYYRDPNADWSGPEQPGQVVDPSKFRGHNSKSTKGGMRPNKNAQAPQSSQVRAMGQPDGIGSKDPAGSDCAFHFCTLTPLAGFPQTALPNSQLWLSLIREAFNRLLLCARPHDGPWKYKVLLFHNVFFCAGDRSKKLQDIMT